MTRVDLSPESLAALASVAVSASEQGDIWRMPGAWTMTWFPSPKDGRPCLVAVLEEAVDGSLFAHLVPGSTARDTQPTTVMVPKGEGGLTQDTYFKFRWSTRIAVADLASLGRNCGSLNASYQAKIDAAIQACNRAPLKVAARKRRAATTAGAGRRAATSATGASANTAECGTDQNVLQIAEGGADQ